MLIAKRLEMSVVKNCKEIANEWEVPIRTVNDWCKKGKIPGAIKVGRDWQIPDGAERPADGRVSSGKYAKKKDGKTRPLPIGVSDYVRAQSEYYYVDKTLLIKEFLDQKPLVSLFTRPRRFGKTLNMDMLRVFFEISDEDTSQYFADKAIWKCGEEYRKHQGKYPVIFLTFKDVKFDSWEETVVKIRGLLQKEFGRHQELLYSLVLYHYMRKKNILLYVDWMHSEALNDGAIVKANLQKALSSSEQFLFLRTTNSELGKNDTKQIRSWCSWEFGNFYGPQLNGSVDRAQEKYYIQVYANLNKKVTRKKVAVPTIIDGLKRLSAIEQGRLVGLMA